MATSRIKNMDDLNTQIGELVFVVPQVVIDELNSLLRDAKSDKASVTLDFIRDFKTAPISGKFADSELIHYARTNRCIVATMDKGLKKEIKSAGGSVLSFSNDRIILEQ